MARHDDLRPHDLGVAGLAMLGALLLVVALLVGSWRSGLLTMRPDDLSMRLPHVPVLPRRAPSPNPDPVPLPRPGPGLEQR